MLVEEVVSLDQVEVANGVVWWSERRPAEEGRQVVVRRRPGSPPEDALPDGCSARTRVHEYGGAAFAVHGDTLYFSDFASQRLYRLHPGGGPVAITSEPPEPAAWRWADAAVSPDGTWLACVRERHGPDGEVVNDLAAVPATGEGPVTTLAGGHDFYAAPRFSPDGRRLAWLSWDHPNMPWDGTDLWVAEVAGGPGLGLGFGPPTHVAGGRDESVSQPRWSPGGTLHYVSDRSGWWNLYAGDEALAPMAAEFTGPDWLLGQCTYGFCGERLVAAYTSQGVSRLGIVGGGTVEALPLPYTAFSSVKPLDDRSVAAVAASASEDAAVVVIHLDDPGSPPEVLRPSRARPLPAGAISRPQPLSYPSTGGRASHAYYYAPRLDGYAGPDGERPPLIVVSHGGPTGSASPQLDPAVQFWTSRGFAVVDVDYGGSTGYGRAYRRLLDGRWGVVDVEDCVAAAEHLAAEGRADPDRLIIRGSSAGGFTTLRALLTGRFAAGATRYGVVDLEALASDTHKFEKRYLDRLVGPRLEAAETYRARSPVHAADRLRTPVIVLQGLDDRVVPPSQAAALVAGLEANRVPHAYLTFEGEAHGFRRAETIIRAVEAELWFYGRILGFAPADPVAPVPLRHADRLRP